MARKIAILGGTGAEGSGLAFRMAKAGENILIGSREPARAQETARLLRERIGGTAQIEGLDNPSAAAACDVAVLTVPFSGVAALLAGDEPVDCDVLVCGNDEKAKQVAFELVGKIPGARPLNGGKLENSRIVESLTALLIGLNMRYKVHGAGIRFTGLPLK